MAVRKNKRKKKIIKIDVVTVYIKTTNNTIITVTNELGNALCWNSSGVCGFKGAEKGTPFAAQVTAEEIIPKLQELGVTKLKIFFHGSGDGRESALEPFVNLFDIITIRDYLKIPFNGCRPPKKRKL